MSDDPKTAPEAPVVKKVLVLKHPSWPTLDVRDENDQPIGDEGALVDVNAEPFLTLLQRGMIVLAPEPETAPAKTGK